MKTTIELNAAVPTPGVHVLPVSWLRGRTVADERTGMRPAPRGYAFPVSATSDDQHRFRTPGPPVE